MKSWQLRSGIIFLGIGTLVSFAPTHAQAQLRLEEIIVTSERREVSLQDAPLAVFALTPGEMERQNITQITDLDKVIPDMQVYDIGALKLVEIRGVESQNGAPLVEASNVVSMDGAVIPRHGGIDNFMFDLQRVEVLKGPQGTLYGRGASGGVINFISNKPDTEEFSGNAMLDVGNQDRIHVQGAANLPITDNWAVRIAGRSLREEGYYDTSAGGADNRAFRVSSLYHFSDNTSLLVAYDMSHANDQRSPGPQILGTYGSEFTLVNTPISDREEQAFWYGPFQEAQIMETDIWGFMAEVNHSFVNFADLTFQYAHRNLDTLMLGNVGVPGSVAGGFILDPTSYVLNGAGEVIQAQYIRNWGIVDPNASFPVQVGQAWQRNVNRRMNDTSNANSYEARLTSNTDSNLRWLLGLYYFTEDASEDFTFWQVASAETTSQAVFGQVNYRFLERFELGIGLRWTKDTKDMVSAPGGNQEGSWSNTTYRFSLSYDFTDDSMIYASLAKGTKPGYLEPAGGMVAEEILNAYELGTKSRFLDNTLEINTEFYYYDYENYQEWGGTQYVCIGGPGPDFQQPVIGGQQCVDVNNNGIFDGDDPEDTNEFATGYSPGGAKQYGVAVGFNYLLTERDSIRGNMAWQRNERKDFNAWEGLLAINPNFIWQPQFPQVDQTGFRFGQGAPFRANLSYSHLFSLGNGGSIDTTLDLRYTGKGIDQQLNYGTPNAYNLPGNPDYWRTDLTVRYEPADGNYYIRGWVNNLWDSDKVISTNRVTNIPGGGVLPQGSGPLLGTFMAPRTYGVSIGANF